MPYKLKWGEDYVIASLYGPLTYQENNQAHTDI